MPTGAETKQEVDRILRVYEEYGKAAASRWGRNRGNQANARRRQWLVQQLLSDAAMLPLTGKKALEIGCGLGGNLASLEALGMRRDDMHGLDLRPEAIRGAKSTYPGINFAVGNAEALDFEDESLDVVMLFVVLSSVNPAMAANIASEVKRVLRPGGGVLWYEMRYRNPSNKNVRPYKRGDIASLFPDWTAHMRSTTVVPPLVRRLGFMNKVAYPILELIPPLHTHYLAVIKKPEA
ncbi:MAG: class I SAM-dependent methyltransferase [Bryobacteraceae bacterium]